MTKEVRTYIWLIAALVVVAIVVYIVIPRHEVLQIATFVILACTLVTLVIYTSDTHSIAEGTRDVAEVTKQDAALRLPVRQATYEMVAARANPKNVEEDPDRTLVRLRNPSTVLVRAKVRCRFEIYGDVVASKDDFDGTNTWYVFPQQMIQGWLPFSALLEQKGKTYDQMKVEYSDGNRRQQLTVNLRIEYKDELGNHRVLPEMNSFFDFKEGQWIPHITRKDDW